MNVKLFLLSTLAIKALQVTGQCKDDGLCDYWTGDNRCLLSPTFMVPRCPVACENPCVCDLSAVTNDTACDCLAKAKEGYCDNESSQHDCNTTCAMKKTINCPELPAPTDPNARLSSTDTSYLSDVTETCREGLEAVNSINTGRKICIASGQWFSDYTVGAPVECRVVNCGQPPAVDNTEVSVGSTLYKNNATYKCVEGFDLMSGQTTLTCGSSGSWLGTPPTCAYVNCGDPPVVEGVDLISTNGSNYRAVARYNCSTGWEYQDGDSILVCVADGHWVGEVMTCTRVECGTPNVLDNCDMTATATSFESEAIYTCHVGYERIVGNYTRVCQAHRIWSGTALVCSAVICSELPLYAGARSWTLEGGIIDVNDHEPFLYQTKVFHECFYQEDGAQQDEWVQECGADKTWQGEEPKCGANSEFKRGTFDPEPEEAPGSWAVGLTIFSVIIFFIVVFIIMDMDTMRKHSRYMRANLKNFRRVVLKRWKRFRRMVQVKTTSLSDIQVREKRGTEEEDGADDDDGDGRRDDNDDDDDEGENNDDEVTEDEVQAFPGDDDNGSEFNFSTTSGSLPSTPKTVTSFV